MSASAPLDDHAPLILFRGHKFVPLISGALHWMARDCLIVADLHLEKLSSFARSGQLLPPYDTAMTLAALERDIVATGARTVIALGDSFHRDEGVFGLLDHDRAHLARLTARARWTWLAGNHDPAPHALGGVCEARLELDGLTFCHEPRHGASGHMSGHLHPAARVAMNGKSARRPCFVWDENLMILPAYGASTGSLNILSPAFHGLFNPMSRQVMVVGRTQIYPVGASRLVRG